MAVTTAVLSFDIGIKNLAWCVTDSSGEAFQIVGWGNYDLLEEKDSADIVKRQCRSCKAKARYMSSEGITCARHIPPTRPIWCDVSGTPFKRVPTFPILRNYFIEHGILTGLPKTKLAAVTKIQEHVSIPLQKTAEAVAAAKKAFDVAAIHDAMYRFLQKEIEPFFSRIREVRIENQPAFKSPVMKTIQVLLYATLRDLFRTHGPIPPFKLVHAGVKVKGKPTGDKGYKARKDGSEKRARELLLKVTDSVRWTTFFEEHTKRSDLADALCMCADATAAAASAGKDA